MKWMLLGPQDLPVSAEVAAAVGMTMRFFSSATLTSASAIAELGMPITRSTFSSSHQRLAMLTPTSTLLWKSALTISIGLPSTEPPKSAIANFAAATSPGPVFSA